MDVKQPPLFETNHYGDLIFFLHKLNNYYAVGFYCFSSPFEMSYLASRRMICKAYNTWEYFISLLESYLSRVENVSFKSVIFLMHFRRVRYFCLALRNNV